MALLSDAAQGRLTQLIREAENRTEAEIVCVVARAASDYRSVPLIWAALAALTLPWPLINLFGLQAVTIYRCQLATAIILTLVLSFSRWRFWLVPRLMKRRRAAQAAREQFFAQGLYRTKAHSGVLIYLAESERYAEILADDRVTSAVEAAFWRQQVETLTAALRRDQAESGLATVIRALGEKLAAALPGRPDDGNELPDRIVML